MERRIPSVKHYAILIGIDHYPDRPLSACVRDVQDAKTYLQSTLRGVVNIQMITSRGDRKSADLFNDSAQSPTRENVVSAFEKATSLAGPGDFVYIHYSGHGTRKPPSGEFSNKSTGDLALVLLNLGEERRVSYLWGYELARLLKAMVDKGLVVTLVLDCCFSASVYRHEDDPDIRFLAFDDGIALNHPPDPKESLASEGPTYRDTSTLPNWLINPDRCAIIAACGPHEVAAEPKINGQRHGIMSYFLLETIKIVGLTRRHGDIYDHLRAKFRGSGLLHQHPILYGNQNQGFFGPINNAMTVAAVPIVVTKRGTLELQAGHAHAVRDGDQFALHPLDTVEDNCQSQGSSVASKVANTRALTSDLELLEPPCIGVRTGWIAEPITRRALQGFPIRLPSDIPQRDEWTTALNARSLAVDANEGFFVFEVSANKDEEYKILQASGEEVINLPSMPQDQTDISQVCSILEHLSRFQLAKNISNETQSDSFQKSYHLYIQSDGNDHSPGVQLEVKHNTRAELIVENRGQKVLYAFVYNLGPSWQMENVFRGTYAVIPPRNDSDEFMGTRRVNLQMKVPDRMRETGYRFCEDIVKVFITSQPTSFELLELPRLGELARATTPNRTDQMGEGLEDWAANDFAIRTSIE